MSDRERLLAAVAGVVPGMPLDRVVALLLDPEGTCSDAVAASYGLLHDLEERVKELTALHGAASLLQDDSIPAEEGLGRIAALLPPAFQFAEDCAARVVHAGESHPTPGWTETPWRLRSAFRTSDGESGLVEVVYLKEFPAASEGPFLAEERRLLDSLAEMIATSLDRRRTEDRLRLFVGTGRIRLFEWDVVGDRYTWPGIPGRGSVGEAGLLAMTREEVDRGIHPDDLPGLRRRVDAALADSRQEEISAEYRSAMPQQDYTWRQLTARVIRGADGRPSASSGSRWTSPRRRPWRSSSGRPRRWRPSGAWPGASSTTSAASWSSSSATPTSPL